MTNSTVPDSLRDRYGTKKPLPRWIGASLATLGLVAAVAVTAWFAWAGPQQIDAKVLGFTITEETEVQIHLQISAGPEQRVSCGLEALNRYKAIVGYTEVSFEPSTDPVRRFTTTVQTTEPGVTGLISQCWTG